jgi:hypothetical protein
LNEYIFDESVVYLKNNCLLWSDFSMGFIGLLLFVKSKCKKLIIRSPHEIIKELKDKERQIEEKNKVIIDMGKAIADKNQTIAE